MKKTSVIVIALMTVGMGGITNAADLALKARAAPSDFSPLPMSTWTGFYVGLNGGGGWGTTSHSATGSIAGNTLASGDFDASGGLFGGTIGYNYQLSGPWVAGLEADLDWADISGSKSFTSAFVSGAVSSRLDWLDTFRGRLGYSFGPSLLYVTGGAAYGSVTSQVSASTAILGGIAGFVGQSDTRLGWTIGAGYEYRFTPQLSGKLEYLYVDLGTNAQLLVDNVKFNTNIFRGGVNWHF
jgi:outer membrane immunogenic protein